MNTIVVTQAGQLLRLRFPWDPRITNAVKTLPGRKWVAASKMWTVPATLHAWDALCELGKELDLPLAVSPSVVGEFQRQRAAQTEAIAIAAADDAIVDFAFLTEPYAHQRAGLAFLQRVGSGGLLWDMGLGKTKTAIDYAEWLTLDHDQLRVLVITPNSVVHNWSREIELHAGHHDYLVLAAPMTLLQRARWVGSHRYTIVNTEALSSGPLAKTIESFGWDLIVVDESQRFKSSKAMRTKRLLRLRGTHRLILSGTPITNSPEDAWSQMTFVQPGLLGSWWSFRESFLLMHPVFRSVVGVKPSMEKVLRDRIATCSYRRTKDEVLDLPPKVYADRLVNLSDTQQRAYTAMQETLRMELPTGDGVVVARTILTQLLRLTQITAGLIGEGDDYIWDPDAPKLAELDWLLRDELASEQVVVFGVYRKELESLWLRYAPPSVGNDTWDRPAIIYGPTSPNRRQELVDQFQAGHRRLLFAQAHSGGIGINLTAARTAIYFTRGWSLEDYRQSQDRLHRIGTQGTVTILHLVARGTVDEDIAKALAKKQDLADRLTGDDARKLAADVLGRKVT